MVNYIYQKDAIMKNFKQFMTETLTPEQRSWVDKRTPKVTHHDELFNNVPYNATKIDDDRFTIPLEGSVDKSRERQIAQHLEHHGIKITDYLGNLAQDKYGRPVTISKALGRLGHDPNLYASDSRIRSKNAGEITPDTHEVLITRHPYDVCGISTDRKWGSCMALPGTEGFPMGGRHHDSLKSDLDTGSLAAYLIPKSSAQPGQELTKDQAISRMSIKKFEGDRGDDIFRPETHSYSEHPYDPKLSVREKYPQFENTVRKFANDRWKLGKSVIYRKHLNLYDDDNVTMIANDNMSELDKIKAIHYDLMHKEIQAEYQKDPSAYMEKINKERIELLNNPLVPSDILHELIPHQYDSFNTTSDTNDLLDSISQHPNVTKESLLHMADVHSHYHSALELLDKYNLHPDEIEKLVNSNIHGRSYFRHEIDEKLAQHPNLTQDGAEELVFRNLPKKEKSSVIHELIKNPKFHSIILSQAKKFDEPHVQEIISKIHTLNQ